MKDNKTHLKKKKNVNKLNHLKYPLNSILVTWDKQASSSLQRLFLKLNSASPSRAVGERVSGAACGLFRSRLSVPLKGRPEPSFGPSFGVWVDGGGGTMHTFEKTDNPYNCQ